MALLTTPEWLEAQRQQDADDQLWLFEQGYGKDAYYGDSLEKGLDEWYS